MDNDNNQNPLKETLDALEEVTEKKSAKLEDVVEAFNSKGLSAILIPPCLIVLSPMGAIPGVPAVCGILICLISVHMMLNRTSVWLPGFLKKRNLKGKKIHSIIEYCKPYVKRMDSWIKPRFVILCHKYSLRLIGLICFVFSLGMMGIGFIPFLPAILALPILVFALGIIAKDGAIILLGYIITVIAPSSLFWIVT